MSITTTTIKTSFKEEKVQLYINVQKTEHEGNLQIIITLTLKPNSTKKESYQQISLIHTDPKIHKTILEYINIALCKQMVHCDHVEFIQVINTELIYQLKIKQC